MTQSIHSTKLRCQAGLQENKKNKDTLVPSITSTFLLAFTPLESNMMSKSLVLKHKHTGNSNYEEKRFTNTKY